MDKEKQIEELTSIIDSFYIRTYANAQAVAKFLVEKYGYQKIDEGSVVIPEKITEETSPETLIKIAKYNEKVRKQGIKELIEKAEEICWDTFVYDDDLKEDVAKALLLDELKEIAKEMGVEL